MVPMDRAQNPSKSPSIRGLIRQGLAVQIALSLLIFAAVVVALIIRIGLVNEQERGTRAIGELRSATVALLGTIGSIDKYARLAETADLKAYQQSIAELRSRMSGSTEWLDGKNRSDVIQTLADIDQWKATVLEPTIADVHNGELEDAQARLLSPRNDESIAKVGLPITTVMEER